MFAAPTNIRKRKSATSPINSLFSLLNQNLTKVLEKNNKKLVRAWAMFDWANSVYSLIITTAIFPGYYSAVITDIYGDQPIPFFGWTIDRSVLYSYSISFSFLIIVLLSPMLSGIADSSGRKKRFMQFFTYLGSLACMGLYFFEGSNVEYGIFCSVTASVGFAGSLVFYNGFLPEVASKDQMDRVSALGFSLGLYRKCYSAFGQSRFVVATRNLRI